MSTLETMMYDWKALPWRKLERSVFKLQKRIYQASSRGDRRTVHRLQRLLIHSRSAACLAVRRVAQDNQGKKTAGVDGVKSLTPRHKSRLVDGIHECPLRDKASPVRRVWIPKPGKDEKRPLGIPIMADRARQALAKMALEPEWEAKFDPRSYGFRPGRSCQDAVKAVYNQIRTDTKYILDADISGCFDHINHKALLDKLDTFPAMRRAVRAWLKAGLSEGGHWFPTTEGTPQGGVISPLLANIALHGLASAVSDAFPHVKSLPRLTGKQTRWKPVVIRYADDFVIFHRDLDALKEARDIAAQWLAGMGLEMKPSKTRITHTLRAVEGDPGFDFLGFHFQQFVRGQHHSVRTVRGKPLGFTANAQPSKESQRRLQRKIRDILRRYRNASQEALIWALNPVIRGWGNYFSRAVSALVFRKMDHLIFQKLWVWAKRRHCNKGRRWIARKYWLFGRPRWQFGADSTLTLFKLSDIPIRRHLPIKSHASPYDGDAIYWSTRMGRYPGMPPSYAKLLRYQKGYCPVCGCFFKPGDSFRSVWRVDGSKDDPKGRYALIHEHCRELPESQCG
jgi:RNA-directed DNA polymerase